MLIRYLPEQERPLEKAVRQGIETLSNTELLALILNSGTRNLSSLDLAAELLAQCEDGLIDLGAMGFDELTVIRGIGQSKAGTLLAAVELGKRIASSRQPERTAVTSSDDVAGMFMERLRYEKREHFLTVLLNTRGEVIASDDVSIGELSSTVVHPREVFVRAVRKSAAAVIFVHNHPSGDPEPSREDLETTDRLVGAGKLLGIRVLDHIILGDGTFRSLRSLGHIS